MSNGQFKTCPRCGEVWSGRHGFLADPQVQLIGYQFNADHLLAGLFLFNHAVPSCGTTMGIEVDAFCDLYSGPVFETRLLGTPACPAYCLRQDVLSACPNPCECRFVRDVLQVLQAWPKQPASVPARPKGAA